MTNKKILAVDDVALNLRTLKAALDKIFEVRIAKSGELALSILNAETVDLILLDIEMPEMSGFEFMEALKAKLSAGDIEKIPPVIFVTAHATPELLTQAKSAGAVGYVIKPFEPQVLIAKVDEALQQSGSA
jgi:putative two-component system response regulator